MRMTTEALHSLQREIIALFENHEHYEGFAKLQQHAFFTGYQALKEEFIYNDLKGTELKRLQQRLYLVIDDCISQEIARLQASHLPEQTEEERIDQAEMWYKKGNDTTDLEAQISAYNETIALNSNHKEAYLNRGLAKDGLGKYKEAIEDYNKAIALKSDYAVAYYNRGNAEYSLGNYQKAIDDYSKAIVLKSDHTNAYNNRGLAKKYLGKYQEAIDDYNNVIALKPDNSNAFWNRALAYADLKNKQGVLDSLREAIRLNTPHKEKAKNLSSFAWLRGDSDFQALVW
jgi:tetratricopeptide (TPR) repeat protein